MELLHGIILKFGHDLSPGRMFESVVLLSIIWSKLKPHLTKIEARIYGLENAFKNGSEFEDARFKKVEGRVSVLETIVKKGEAKS